MSPARALSAAALAVAALAVVIVILNAGSSYTVHAHFADAGQLVTGDDVEVGGIPIGQISSIGVTQNGEADIALSITDGSFAPLHQGTLAMIRAAGTAGIANRYVAIEPGPSGAPSIPNGGVLPATATRGIVDLDMLLDAFGPRTRASLRADITGGATAFGAPRAAAQDFRLLEPATSQASLLGAELVRDQPALSALVGSTATTLHALNAGAGALAGAVTGLASVLRTVAGERTALADTLSRTTDVLHRLRVTFSGLRATLPVVGTMLADARPAVAPLVGLLRRVVPDASLLLPALTDLRAQLPPTDRTLLGLPALARVAGPALASAQTAITDALPIFTGLRPYSIDWMAGAVTLIGSVQYAYYDQLGHYARETILGGQASLSGLASLIPQITVPAPSAPVYRTGLLARCPGAAAQPALDRSNPWIPDPTLCNPRDSPR